MGLSILDVFIMKTMKNIKKMCKNCFYNNIYPLHCRLFDLPIPESFISKEIYGCNIDDKWKYVFEIEENKERENNE